MEHIVNVSLPLSRLLLLLNDNNSFAFFGICFSCLGLFGTSCAQVDAVSKSSLNQSGKWSGRCDVIQRGFPSVLGPFPSLHVFEKKIIITIMINNVAGLKMSLRSSIL